MIAGRSRQLRNVPTDSPKPLRTQISRYTIAIYHAVGGDVEPISAILSKTAILKMVLIDSPSPPTAWQMAIVYRLICGLRGFGGSVGMLCTCPKVLKTIFHNF